MTNRSQLPPIPPGSRINALTIPIAPGTLWTSRSISVSSNAILTSQEVCRPPPEQIPLGGGPCDRSDR